jgi:hypothetical protein
VVDAEVIPVAATDEPVTQAEVSDVQGADGVPSADDASTPAEGGDEPGGEQA